MRVLPILGVALFLFSGPPALAQFSLPTNSGSELAPLPQLTLEPTSPEPGDMVTASVNAYTSELSGASVVWSYGGVTIPDSEDKTKVTFTADVEGNTKNLSAVFTTLSGNKRVISRGVTPRYTDIIIEPQTHVPSFYLGRPLASVGSSINVTAIISGLGPTTDYLYSWRHGRTVVGEPSLRGKNSVTFDAPLDKNIILSLEVRDLAGEIVADKTISIPSVDPVVRFYESNTLLGLKQIPVDRNFSLVGNSALLRAEPYYLDSRVYNEPDILEWKIDNNVYENSKRNPYEVALQKNASSGRSKLNFHVRDTTQFIQGAYGNVDINL